MLPLPSSPLHQNVKVRHRNTMTATTAIAAVVQLPAGGQRNNNKNSTLSKEKHSGEDSTYSRLSAVFSNNSSSDSDEHQCFMTHRRQQTLSESSVDSLTNEPVFIDDFCTKYGKKTSINSAETMMRPNDVQRQTSSISQMSNAGVVNPGCNRSRAFNLFAEVAIRVMLYVSAIVLERTTPFKRIVHPEEAWLYMNPMSIDYVSNATIAISVIFGPILLNIISYLLHRDGKDFAQANLAFTLAVGLTGFLTSLIKISVGRLRPDFFYRCYPDGVTNNSNFDDCTGDVMVVNEGRKSFPSGHSSMGFAAFGFMAFYLASKLHIFNERGRGHAWRMCVSIAPLIVAIEVAISRTCDYHHHWQDVVVGSLLGLCISYLSYRQYFPSIFARNCHRAYPRNGTIKANQVDCYVPADEHEEVDETQPLIGGEKDNKWI